MLSSVRATLPFLLFFVALCAAGCASSPKTPDSDGEATAQSGSLFEVPRHWEVVDEREGGTLYQANLKNYEGAGRMLIGRLKLQREISERESYLFKLHTDLVERLRGEVDFAPFSEERLAWSNGIVGYRTKMRGALGREAVIVEGITFTDGDNAYFHYGLFPEESYEKGRVAYAEVLRTLGPIRGAERMSAGGLDISGANEVASSEIGSDGSASPDAYQSPTTHLGLAEWGSRRDALVQSTGVPLRQGGNAVGYRCQFLGTDDCVVIYIFEFGQLTHGGYLLEANFENPQEYVARYLRMTKLLTEKFGRPTQSSAIWNNPEFKNQGAKWGEALTAQHVLFGTVWEMGPTKVVHSLRKDDDGNIEHRIVMSNDELRKALQAQSAQASKAP